MARAALKSFDLKVVRVGGLSKTSKGNCYLECDTDQGIVAFWGKANMSNIESIQRLFAPFRVRCDCVPSNWTKHKLWVLEHSLISIIPEPTEKSAQEPAAVTVDDLAKMRRALIQLLDQLNERPSQQIGLGARIRELSRQGVIPREVASLMELITNMRNAAEYEQKQLTESESQAVRSAWKAILEWASSKGLRIPELSI